MTLIGSGLALRHAEHARLAEKRSEAERLVSRAQIALAEANWTEAKADLAGALAEVGREPLLADVRARAKRWQDDVDRRLAQQKVRRDALARRQRFEQGRDEVLF